MRWARCFRYLPKGLSKSFLLPRKNRQREPGLGCPLDSTPRVPLLPRGPPGTHGNGLWTVSRTDSVSTAPDPLPGPRAVPAEGLDLSASISCTAQDNEAHLA